MPDVVLTDEDPQLTLKELPDKVASKVASDPISKVAMPKKVLLPDNVCYYCLKRYYPMRLPMLKVTTEYPIKFRIAYNDCPISLLLMPKNLSDKRLERV